MCTDLVLLHAEPVPWKARLAVRLSYTWGCMFCLLYIHRGNSQVMLHALQSICVVNLFGKVVAPSFLSTL